MRIDIPGHEVSFGNWKSDELMLTPRHSGLRCAHLGCLSNEIYVP